MKDEGGVRLILHPSSDSLSPSTARSVLFMETPTGDLAAQPAHAADRFAREIVAFLILSLAARSRRLMGKPLGGALSLPVLAESSLRQYAQ
jgi:hypothetical protein